MPAWIDSLGLIVGALPLLIGGLYFSRLQEPTIGICLCGLALALTMALAFDAQINLGLIVAPPWWHM